MIHCFTNRHGQVLGIAYPGSPPVIQMLNPLEHGHLEHNCWCEVRCDTGEAEDRIVHELDEQAQNLIAVAELIKSEPDKAGRNYLGSRG